MGRVRKVTHSGTGISTQHIYYTYDSLGRKLSERGAYNLETQYVYNDTAGSWTVQYDPYGSYAVQYNTDALGRVDTIKVGSHTVADYGYDPLSRINSIVFGNGSNNSVYAKFTADVWGFGADEATSPYRFTARRMDEETGNYYYRNRYYHTDSGRFMSNDPVGYGDGLNMYAYVANDPVNRRDPFGLTGVGDNDVLNEIVVTGRDLSSGPTGADGRFTTVEDLEDAGFADTYSGNSHRFTPYVAFCPPGTTPIGTASDGALTCQENTNADGDSLTGANDSFLNQLRGYARDLSRAIKNNACDIGNDIADFADATGDASLKITVTGIVTAGVGFATGQAEIVGAGAFIVTVGEFAGFAAGALQFTAGVLQGIGANDYRNSLSATASLGMGVFISKALQKTIPRGADAVANGYTRDKVAQATQNNKYAGNVVGAIIGARDFLSVKKANCNVK